MQQTELERKILYLHELKKQCLDDEAHKHEYIKVMATGLGWKYMAIEILERYIKNICKLQKGKRDVEFYKIRGDNEGIDWLFSRIEEFIKQ